jgi:hypothetical protein
MDENHGSSPPKNAGPLPNLPPGHPIWTPMKTAAITLMNELTRRYWKAGCYESGMSSLEEGSRKSTSAMGQLVGFLSYLEAHFGIMRRLADYYLNKAPSFLR